MVKHHPPESGFFCISKFYWQTIELQLKRWEEEFEHGSLVKPKATAIFGEEWVLDWAWVDWAAKPTLPLNQIWTLETTQHSRLASNLPVFSQPFLFVLDFDMTTGVLGVLGDVTIWASKSMWKREKERSLTRWRHLVISIWLSLWI